MILPAGADPAAMTLLKGRALRAFADGYVAILLPVYLLALGLEPFEVGLLATVTLAGSAGATLAVGTCSHRFRDGFLLKAATVLMMATGLLFAATSSFWPLMLIAFVGTLNPSSGDVSVFLPLEHARLASMGQGSVRTALFARYSLTGALLAALGSLAAVVPDYLSATFGLTRLDALRWMFILYGMVGALVCILYRRLPVVAAHTEQPPMPLGPSRLRVVRLAALFSVDSFAGGLVVNSLLALWLLQRFEMSLGAAGAFFFWVGLCSAASQLVAPLLARRIGLLNTMVFTHIPASVCLIAAALVPSLELALGLLIARSLFSQMDVPARGAFVMAVVTPPERTAAASFTAVPRSLAAAAGPTLGGALFAAGWLAAPLVAAGTMKITYDLMLWYAFRRTDVQGH